MTNHIELGSRVRIDIPDKTDPEFDQYHGMFGEVGAVLEDDAGSITGDERDSFLCEVELDSGETVEFRWRDLRPASNGPY